MTGQVRLINEWAPDQRQVAETINLMLRGRGNATGTFALMPDATETTVSDNLFESQQVPVLVALSASAAAAPVYISSRSTGEFVVSHDADSATDRRFAYVRAG
jgi:hypothetical protein